MLIRKRIHRNADTKRRFEESRARTASCIPALESEFGGQFIHTEQFDSHAFCVTVDCDYGIDLLWVHNHRIDPIGVRTSEHDWPYFTVSCNNYSGEPAEYDELKNSPISPAYSLKLIVVDGKPYKAYMVRIDYLLDYIDSNNLTPKPSPNGDPHDYYAIPISGLPKNAVKDVRLDKEYNV